MQTTTTAPTRAERLTWLLPFLGHETYAALQRTLRGPLGTDQLNLIDRFLTEYDDMRPASTAIKAASDDELPAVIGRILAEAGAR